MRASRDLGSIRSHLYSIVDGQLYVLLSLPVETKWDLLPIEGLVRLLLGIISDSHDNLPKIDAAVAKLNASRVDLVLHAGDYCAPFAALRF